MNMKKAIIFDNDGLMIDSENATYEEYDKYLNELGYTFSKDLYLTFLGKTKLKIIDLFKDAYGQDFPFDQVWDEVHIRLDNRLESNLPIKYGLIELLNYCKEKEYKLAIATSSDRIRINRILKPILPYFDYVICGDEVKNSKPNPEIFLKACNKLNVLPQEAIVIEDSESGILAAYNGNIDVICIPDMKYREKEYEQKATIILNNLKDVISYLG